MYTIFSTQQKEPPSTVQSLEMHSALFLTVSWLVLNNRWICKRNTWPGAPAAQSSVVLLIPTLYLRLLSSFLYSHGSNRKGERITSKAQRKAMFLWEKEWTLLSSWNKRTVLLQAKREIKAALLRRVEVPPRRLSWASRWSAVLSVGVFLQCFMNPDFF